MDIAILKKMSIYAAEAKVAELLRESEEQTSTLIKADISLFHQMPERGLSDVSLKTDVAEAAVEETLDSPEGDVEDSEIKDLAPKQTDYERGLEDGKSQSDKVHTGTIRLLQNAVNAMQRDLDKMAGEIEHSHLSMISFVFKTAFPELLKLQLEEEILSVLRQACSTAAQGDVVLHVHPDDLEDSLLLVSSKSLKVAVEANESLKPEEMKVSWKGGGADIDCQSVAKACLTEIEGVLSQFQHPHTEESVDD